MLSHLVKSGTPIVSYQYKSGVKYVLTSGNDSIDPSTTYDSVVNLPMAVICNGYTASAAEIFTSVIRDYRDTGDMTAVIVGEKTYGKGVMQSSFKNSDGSSITMTTAYYNPPSDVNYHGIGITPDVIVEASDINDVQLERAIYELKNLINNN